MTKQHLVVVRAGDNSLHPHWLAGDGDRTWDLVVSYFGDDPDIFKVDDVVRIDSKGPKWPALYELFSLYPILATDYDYIWLPDDDVMASKADIKGGYQPAFRYLRRLQRPLPGASSSLARARPCARRVAQPRSGVAPLPGRYKRPGPDRSGTPPW